jgi:AAHS family 4-hydroxybenzoate transporter-like MFS transporter
VQFILDEVAPDQSSGGRVRHLLSGEYRWRTMSLWVTYFMGLLVVYLLTGWMPTLIKDAGVTIERAAMVTAMFQLGGLAGILLVGYAMDRMSAKVVIAAAYLGGAICVFAIGLVDIGTGLLGFMIFAAGFCISGAQTGLNAFAPSQYPTAFRATGVSWMLGVGRFGGILGSMTGGILLSFGLPMNAIFAVLGVPAILAAIAILSSPRPRFERSLPELNH